MAEKKSWRDLIKIHPAADVFPMLPEDELRKLGEDIDQNGLKEPITMFRPDDDADAKRICLLDGRNRLAAMELIGMNIDPQWPRAASSPSVRWIHTNPEAYVISKNIRRRHLTKEQQANLIVKVIAVSHLAGADFAKLARSVKRDSGGHVQGSVKDPIKEKAVEEGKKHGISKRTIERSIAKTKGPILQRKIRIEPQTTTFTKGLAVMPMAAPKPIAGNIEDIVRKVMAFVDRNLADQSHESLSLLSDRLTAAIQHRMHGAPRKLSRPELNGEWETIGR